jgi:hypothetical protein
MSVFVQRIEVRRTEIAILLASEDSEEEIDPPVLTLPWSKMPHRRHREILLPEGSPQAQAHPLRHPDQARPRRVSGGEQLFTSVGVIAPASGTAAVNRH